MTQLHIITAHPNSLFSQGLAMALQQKGHYQVSSIAYTDIPKTQSYNHTLPIFLWQQNEQQEILESIDTIRQAQDKIFILIQSAISKEQVRSLAQRGKTAIVDLNVSIDELHQYIQELFITHRQWVFSPHIISILMEHILAPESHPATTPLNNKEQQIIALARQGYSTQQTASALNISKNTVAVYRSKILRKTGAESINQLIARYNE